MAKYSRTFVQHFRKIKAVFVPDKKKHPADTCMKYNGRAPGLHPHNFCYEIVLLIVKDLDMHSAERYNLD